MKSNCLFEAIKAKLKNPKEVRIICLPKKWNDNVLHFMWIKNNSVFHYENLNEKFQLFFNGKIKEQPLDTFEAFFLKRLADKNMNVLEAAKKYNLPSLTIPGYLNWTTYCPDFDENNLPEENKICKKVMICENNQIHISDIKDVVLNNKGCIQWKYVSPYCQEYYLLERSER